MSENENKTNVSDITARIRARREAAMPPPEGEEQGTPTSPPSNVFEQKRWARLIEEAAQGGPSSREPD